MFFWLVTRISKLTMTSWYRIIFSAVGVVWSTKTSNYCFWSIAVALSLFFDKIGAVQYRSISAPIMHNDSIYICRQQIFLSIPSNDITMRHLGRRVWCSRSSIGVRDVVRRTTVLKCAPSLTITVGICVHSYHKSTASTYILCFMNAFKNMPSFWIGSRWLCCYCIGVLLIWEVLPGWKRTVLRGQSGCALHVQPCWMHIKLCWQARSVLHCAAS